jgi:L-iditol 2-dehydrogenase/L-gulonate 5-dehydrogenase
VPVPASLRNPMGALVEPSAVGVHVNRRAGTAEGDSVLVIGAGVIGLVTAMVARAMGAGRIALVDRFESRGEMAGLCGFSEFGLSGAGTIDSLREAGAFDVVFDCVGLPATIAAGIAALAPGGRWSGRHAQARLAHRYRLFGGLPAELSFILCRNYVKADFALAIELIADGAHRPEPPIVTATFPLVEFPARWRRWRIRPRSM